MTLILKRKSENRLTVDTRRHVIFEILSLFIILYLNFIAITGSLLCIEKVASVWGLREPYVFDWAPVLGSLNTIFILLNVPP